MSLTPWNRQEEWYQQMINASTGNYLPSITAQDEGKVLTVENDGSWGVENVPQELPAVETTDKDKYLHTNASTGAVEWADAPDELPAVTDADAGKVLAVNDSGVWVASMPSGGSPLVVTDTAGTLDKTWQEIHDAMLVGGAVVRYSETDIGSIVMSRYNNKGGEYVIRVNSIGGTISTYNASSASGYPTFFE